MTAVRVYLFGAPHIQSDDKLIEVPRRKTLALFAYLLVTRQWQSRDKLATLFWPDHDQSRARASLRREIFHLKQVLGENALSLDGDNISWNPDLDLWLDVWTYESNLTQAASHDHSNGSLCLDCSTLLGDAVSLYTDRFMAGFSLADSPEFDEWQFFEAESLTRSLSEALQKLIDWHCTSNDLEQAITYARRWLAVDPLHETAHRMLMRLYAWSGQQAAALRQYQECLRVLGEGLGIEPEEETRRLYEAIRSRTLDPLEGVGNGRPEAAAIYPPVEEKQVTQTIRFCTAPDGVRLAYAVIGQGPPLVKVANWLSHLEHDWNSPVWRHWLTGLARNNTLIRYDERGCGLSDWNVDEFSMNAWVLDLETVVDALGLERFPLLGISQGASIAVAYAVRHPERVSRLILYGGYIRGRLHRNLTPQQKEELDLMIRLIEVGWGKEHPAFRQVFSSLFLPEGTPEQLQAFNELQRVSSTPEIAARIVNGHDAVGHRLPPIASR